MSRLSKVVEGRALRLGHLGAAAPDYLPGAAVLRKCGHLVDTAPPLGAMHPETAGVRYSMTCCIPAALPQRTKSS